uniref:Paired like homeodomain 1 n=1 Tax=Canis lupus dingo TaxID=286419 RepID=A0A8C0JZW5_CANLU
PRRGPPRAARELRQRVVRHGAAREGARRGSQGAGGQRCGRRRLRWRGGPRQEKEATAATHALHKPAVARAGGHVPEEPLPRHEHAGGDRCVDQPHGAAREGLVQEPASQVAEAGAQPAAGPVQGRLRAAVQRPGAALRGRVRRRLLLQQLGRQELGAGAALHQELHLLQLHEPAVVAVHVLGAQLHLLHDHAVEHGPGRRARHAQLGPQQHQQPHRLLAQLGHVAGRLPLRHARLALQRLPGHVQLEPGQPAAQVQAALVVRLRRPAGPGLGPQRVPVQQLTAPPGPAGSAAGSAPGRGGAGRRGGPAAAPAPPAPPAPAPPSPPHLPTSGLVVCLLFRTPLCPPKRDETNKKTSEKSAAEKKKTKKTKTKKNKNKKNKTDELQFPSGWRGWCACSLPRARRAVARRGRGAGGRRSGEDALAARVPAALAPERAAAPANWTCGARAGRPPPRRNRGAPSKLGPAERTLARFGSELERALGRGGGAQPGVGDSLWRARAAAARRPEPSAARAPGSR